jgi:nitroimidazol reductase NimA-like FMN-containing flavoprotein (pyridoxamine 5'-phosphate oxidase superfamily)
MLYGMEPIAELIKLPDGYGAPVQALAWDDVRQRLERATHYWLATTRPDGRPHTVPIDAVWLEGACHFGGHAATVHQRNLRRNPLAALHLESATETVIAEGTAEWITPSAEGARRLAAVSREKYGYAPTPDTYTSGVWRLRPTVVLAWTALDRDATRFRFS